MKYMTPKEAAQKWGISQRRVHTLCLAGRIEGAERHGWTWLIPETTIKPKDGRIKSGRYIKSNSESPDAAVDTVAVTSKTQPEAESGRFLIPVPPEAAVFRPRLIEKIAPPGSRLTYIHADPGYGKTTLLMQFARGRKDVVWLSLDENDSSVPYFLRHLEDALREKLQTLDFYATEHLPFVGSKAFIPNVLSALLRAIGRHKLTLILDDVHVLADSLSAELLTRLAKGCPPNLTLVMASRHELWSGLYRLKMDGRIAEITRSELRFNREEARMLWGFFDEVAYSATEGWALALQSYRVASAKYGKLPLPRSDRDLYRYLLEEIFQQLPEEMRYFLQATAWLPELNPDTCDRLLNIRNSQEILEELVRRNIFTMQVSFDAYRYHTLFGDFLRQKGNSLGREILRKVMKDCFARGEYEQAADYALLLDDAVFIHDCIGAALGRPFGKGRYDNLKRYFDCLETHNIELSPRVLLARGMFLSSQGRFFEAERCLRAAMPHLNGENFTVWRYAMTHKARILRNHLSYAESSRLIDSLLPLPEDAPLEDWYLVMIEKIHNLTLSTHLREALELTMSMIEKCAVCGNTKVKAWFERYLTAIYFYKGDWLSALRYYEKSLFLPVEEQDWLLRHSVGAYAAKAYQATGQEEKALPLMEEELTRLLRLGFYEELCLNYLIYAEILVTAEIRNISQGKAADFSGFNRYLSLAEEHAALNRNTREYVLFARILRMCAEFYIQPAKVLQSIEEILPLAENTSPFFQTYLYGRIANALHVLGQDVERSKVFYKKCIAIGEGFGALNFSLTAYGELAAIYLR